MPKTPIHKDRDPFSREHQISLATQAPDRTTMNPEPKSPSVQFATKSHLGPRVPGGLSAQTS